MNFDHPCLNNLFSVDLSKCILLTAPVQFSMLHEWLICLWNRQQGHSEKSPQGRVMCHWIEAAVNTAVEALRLAAPVYCETQVMGDQTWIIKLRNAKYYSYTMFATRAFKISVTPYNSKYDQWSFMREQTH